MTENAVYGQTLINEKISFIDLLPCKY